MLKELRLLAYDRDLSKDNKEYWERDDQLSEAIWREAEKYVLQFPIKPKKNEKSFSVGILFSFINDLLEKEALE